MLKQGTLFKIKTKTPSGGQEGASRNSGGLASLKNTKQVFLLLKGRRSVVIFKQIANE
jgi:hypothetical protein